MKEKSSNIEMEEHFNILKNIKKVEASNKLYEKVLGRINQRAVISYRAIGTVAAMFCCLLLTDIYVVSKELQNKNTAKIEVLILVNTNTLYNE